MQTQFNQVCQNCAQLNVLEMIYFVLTEKFDVLRGRLLRNHNDFHWQLGGQINHQPCSRKAARVIRCTTLFRAYNSHRQPSASLIKGIPQPDKTFAQTGQTLSARTVAEAF